MTLPTIHLNGTSPDRLIADLCAASSALDAAYEALKQTAPNGRDWYPQGPAAMAAAEAEHMSRLRRVDEVKKEVDELTFAISQMDGNR